MTDLNEVRANLLARIPSLITIRDDLTLEDDGREYEATLSRAFGAYFNISVTAKRLTITVENVPGHQMDVETDHGDEIAILAMIAAAEAIAQIPESDAWEATEEYGYADDHFTGTESWEDQKGMEMIKKGLSIPTSWYLMKIVNFNAKKLQEMEQWLVDNCTASYRRVNWGGGCTTKIGVAFQSEHDAIFYKLRWR